MSHNYVYTQPSKIEKLFAKYMALTTYVIVHKE